MFLSQPVTWSVPIRGFFQAHKRPCCTKGTTFSMDAFRVARSLMRLKKSSNSIDSCDRLLQEPFTFPSKISRTFHESDQSNTATIYMIPGKNIRREFFHIY